VCGYHRGTTTTTTTSTTATTATSTRNRVTTATPYQEDIVTDCDLFHFVVSSDECDTTPSDAGITTAEFYEWNPDVGSTCASLWLGIMFVLGFCK